MWRRGEGSSANRQRERGSAIIEAAIVTPVFFLLLFGVLEVGLLFRSNLTTTHASRDGARAASVYGRESETDFLVLQTIRHAADAMGVDAIEFVVIYKLDTPTSPMDSDCLVASKVDVCNRYVRSDFDLALDYTNGNPTPHFRCAAGTAVDRFWCPADRDSSIGNADYVGVYIQTEHDYITGFFGESRLLDDTTVIRIEPELNE